MSDEVRRTDEEIFLRCLEHADDLIERGYVQNKTSFELAEIFMKQIMERENEQS